MTVPVATQPKALLEVYNLKKYFSVRGEIVQTMRAQVRAVDDVSFHIMKGETLGVSIQAQVLNILKDLQQEFGLTYLFIAHNLGVVEHISDRVAVMYLGKIVELASREDLFRSPKHHYTRALMSAVAVPNPLARRERIILQGDVPSPLNPPAGCRFHTHCWMARDICRTSEPAFEEKAPGHWSACHFAHEVESSRPEYVSTG